MKSEAELRELHQRLVRVLNYARGQGIRAAALREMIQIKVSLEYILDMETPSRQAWQAATFKAIQNLEGLQQTYERSRRAANN